MLNFNNSIREENKKIHVISESSQSSDSEDLSKEKSQRNLQINFDKVLDSYSDSSSSNLNSFQKERNPHFSQASPINLNEKKEKKFGFPQDKSSSSDDDLVNDLRAFDDALMPSQDRSDSEKSDLDQAVVIQSSSDESRSSSNSDLLRDLKVSTENLKNVDFYENQASSPEIHQAVSYLPTDLIESRMKTDENFPKRAGEDKKAEESTKENEKTDDKLKIQVMTEEKPVTVKQMPKSSLILEEEVKPSKKVDPKGDSFCRNCSLL